MSQKSLFTVLDQIKWKFIKALGWIRLNECYQLCYMVCKKLQHETVSCKILWFAARKQKLLVKNMKKFKLWELKINII